MYEQYQLRKELQEISSDDANIAHFPHVQEQLSQAQAAVIAETDPSKDVEKLFLDWEGKELVDGKVVKVDKEIINSHGIKQIKSYVKPLMVNNTRFARFDEKEVRRLTLKLTDDLTDDIGMNWRDYGIKDRSTCDLIISTFATMVFSILSRAEGQNEKNWLGKISFESIRSGENVLKPKKSMLSSLKL